MGADQLPDRSALRDEDDFTHYFNATARLSAENARLRAENEALKAILDGCDDAAIERGARKVGAQWPGMADDVTRAVALNVLRAAGAFDEVRDGD